MRRAGPALILALVTVADAQDSRPLGRQPDGSVLVASQQVIQPFGYQAGFPGRPTDLVLLEDGRTLVVKNLRDLVFVDTTTRTIVQTLPLPAPPSPRPREGCSFHGILAEPGGRILVTGTHQTLFVARRENGIARWEGDVVLPGPDGKGNSVPGGIARAGAHVLVTLSRNNALGVVDLEANKLERTIPVGVAPYAVVVHEGRAFVSNWGGRHPRAGEAADTSSSTKVLVDAETNVASSGTVSVVDLEQGALVREIDVGLHPCGLALDKKAGRLYVANANSDTVSVIDVGSLAVLRTLSVRPRAELPFGSGPNALALAPDGKRLFVANGTNNAVAVLDPQRQDPLLGLLPVGWYPGALLYDARRHWLLVANTKGDGTQHPPTGKRGFNSKDHWGSVTILTELDEPALARGSSQVAANNHYSHLRAFLAPPRPGVAPLPVPERHGEPSLFEHVIYVIKENRTYDQVFGDLAAADPPRGNGDPSLCVFGAEVTPNHHALATGFVLLDNFYCGGVLSADGHQWTNEAYVTDYIEKMFGDFVRSYPFDGDDPLAYASSGFLWDNALRHNKTFRCYGEMVQATITPNGTWREIYDDFVQGGGKFKIRATSHIDAIKNNMCEAYPGFPNTVPDVYRAATFVSELARFEREGRFPNLVMMLLPNDHTSGTRPGMPRPEAMVADNDVALGQIVEAVSKSRFWRKTCIFVVQDDPQAGWDHVDAHRTVAFAISPYTKRGAVVSTQYTQAGMVKTIELILGLPPMNQMDLCATPMRECFQAQPDLRPYVAHKNRIPLDRLNAALEQLQGPARRDALASLAMDFSKEDLADEATFNRVLWHAMKGHETPYPERRR
jgi:YVTN family beta-propeller protein